MRLFRKPQEPSGEGSETEVTVEVQDLIPWVESDPEPATGILELSLTARRIAALFYEQGWTFADGQVPLAGAIVNAIVELAIGVHEGNEAQWTNRYRFAAVSDPECPGTTDIYMHVGTYREKVDLDAVPARG